MKNINANEMKNRFRADLANEGVELRKLLSRNRASDDIETVRNIMDDSSERIESLCREYAAEAGISDFKMPEQTFSLPLTVLTREFPYPNGVFSEIVETTLLFTLADLAVSYININSAAVLITISIALTAVGMFMLSKAKKQIRCRMIVAALMRSYESKVVPQLLKWFDDEICGSNGDAGTCGEKSNENFSEIFGKTGNATL